MRVRLVLALAALSALAVAGMGVAAATQGGLR